MQNQNAFWKPPETCAIGKHPEGRVRLTTQLPVINPKNQLLPIAEFFLEVPSKKQGFWLCYDPVLNPSYTEMHPRSCVAKHCVQPSEHHQPSGTRAAQMVWTCRVNPKRLGHIQFAVLVEIHRRAQAQDPQPHQMQWQCANQCRALPGSVSFALQAR